MKRRTVVAVLTASAMAPGLLPAGAAASSEDDAFAKKLHGMYDEIEMEYRPGVRWWLAEGLNTDETLKANIEEIYNNGFGSVEFLAMPEPSADSSVYGWGSDEWTEDTMTIIRKPRNLTWDFL